MPSFSLTYFGAVRKFLTDAKIVDKGCASVEGIELSSLAFFCPIFIPGHVYSTPQSNHGVQLWNGRSYSFRVYSEKS